MGKVWYKNIRFTSLDFIIIVMFAVVHFLISFGIQALAVVMGPAGVIAIPMLIMNFWYLLCVVVVSKVKTFLYYGVILAIPFTLTPAIVPPHPLKIAVVAWIHITGFIILYSLRHDFKAAMLTLGAWLAVNMYLTNLVLFLALAPPAAEMAIKGLPIFIPIGIVLGLIAGWLAILVKKPLEKSNLVKRIRGWG